jgi:polysaccharide biosynthesis transport protein
MTQYDLNLRDYLRIIRKRSSILVITIIITTLISTVYVFTRTASYEASTTVRIEARRSVSGIGVESSSINPADMIESETRTIRSYSVMKRAAIALGMVKEGYPLVQINDAISQLQGSVQTERVGYTNMIKIAVISDSPVMAINTANVVDQAYIEENVALKAKEARATRVFIEKQLDIIEKRLKEIDERRRQYTDEVKNIRMAEPIEKKLNSLEFDLAELMQKYTDKHPKVIMVREQIADMERQIKGFSGQEIEYARLARESEVNKKLYGMLKEKLEESRISEAQNVSDVSVVDPAVMAHTSASANKMLGIIVGILLGAVLGLSMIFLFESLDTSIATVEEVENLVKLPVLGMVPSITEDESDKKAGLLQHVIGYIFPYGDKKPEQKPISLITHFKPQAPSSEAFRNIDTNLKLGPNRKTILVTSSGPREGKSTVTCNLGIVMAQTGLKTLLVSADLRRPTISKAFGVRREPGLTELIMGAIKLEDALCSITDILVGGLKFDDIRKTHGLENIWILPSGHLPTNPVELLESKRLIELLDRLKEMFDVILIDAPPVLPVTDSSLIAPHVDCVVIVYEIGRMSREAIMRTKSQMESVGANIAGLVLNNTSPHMEAISTYPYYGRDKYYTRIDTEKKDKA